MTRIISTSNVTSLKSEAVGQVISDLENKGFAVMHLQPSAYLASDLLVVSAIIGREVGNSLGYHFIEGESDQTHLAAHTEGIAYESGIVPYFALGCIQPAAIGGNTRIFDGRKAAGLVTEKGLTNVVIEYGSLAHPEQVIRHSLIVTDSQYGQVLRYRGRVVTNKLITNGLSEDYLYQTVDAILEESLLHSQAWQVGDLVFVNNKFTLHDRLPYKGRRSMLRVRYDDGLHTNFIF